MLPKFFFPTAGDFTHGSDGRIVRRDATEGFGLYRSIAGDPQHQSEQALVPTEGLLGQLAAWQRGGEGQMELGGGKPRAEEWAKTIAIKLCNSCKGLSFPIH